MPMQDLPVLPSAPASLHLLAPSVRSPGYRGLFFCPRFASPSYPPLPPKSTRKRPGLERLSAKYRRIEKEGPHWGRRPTDHQLAINRDHPVPLIPCVRRIGDRGRQQNSTGEGEPVKRGGRGPRRFEVRATARESNMTGGQRGRCHIGVGRVGGGGGGREGGRGGFGRRARARRRVKRL